MQTPAPNERTHRLGTDRVIRLVPLGLDLDPVEPETVTMHDAIDAQVAGPRRHLVLFAVSEPGDEVGDEMLEVVRVLDLVQGRVNAVFQRCRQLVDGGIDAIDRGG